MDTIELELTPQQREALQANSGLPIHISDKETHKVYLLFEQGAYPDLEEEIVREALERARGQISRGEVSSATIEELIGKARQASRQQP